MEEINMPTDIEVMPEKGHYETVREYTKEVPVYDENGNQTGTKTIVTGRERKWVWTDEEELAKQRKKRRVLLLNAFDKWEKAVLRGRESDDYSIMVWYRDLLDLKETAFENVPVRIQYYF